MTLYLRRQPDHRVGANPSPVAPLPKERGSLPPGPLLLNDSGLYRVRTLSWRMRDVNTTFPILRNQPPPRLPVVRGNLDGRRGQTDDLPRFDTRMGDTYVIFRSYPAPTRWSVSQRRGIQARGDGGVRLHRGRAPHPLGHEVHGPQS